MRVPLVASNELAIVTKSIAFVSPPRTTDNLVENCHYLSGGRNTGVSGKRGRYNKSTRRKTLVENVAHTYSGRTYTRYVQLQRRNTSRNGGEKANAELDV